MFIAKNENLIVLIKDTKEELEEALKFINYTSIEKTDINYQLYEGSYLTPEEITAKERERIDNLSLTAADVERAIFNAKGMDFDDIVEEMSNAGIVGLSIKRLKIELKANNFYRSHPYIDLVGQVLGYTSDDMDYLFENKKLPDKSSEV